MFEQLRADSMKSVQEFLLVWPGHFPCADNLGSYRWVRAAISHLAQVIENFGLRHRSVDERPWGFGRRNHSEAGGRNAILRWIER